MHFEGTGLRSEQYLTINGPDPRPKRQPKSCSMKMGFSWFLATCLNSGLGLGWVLASVAGTVPIQEVKKVVFR